MSRRTRNSLASISEKDVQRFVSEPSHTNETEDFQTERSDSRNDNENKEYKICGDKVVPKLLAHVADADDQINRKHQACDECKSNKQEIAEIKMMLNEIKIQQIKDRENAIIKEEESVATIKSLYEENNEMASEIAFLKASITELVNDNENMRKILDIKQNKWVKVEGKPSSSKATTSESATIPTISTENQFATLTDENCEGMSNTGTNNNINAQINDYRMKEKSKFQNRKNARNATKNQVHLSKNQPETHNAKRKTVLVIGDSMVKHIDQQKIERAAGCKSVVHSYSGAKVEQISHKIKEYFSEDDKYDAVVLHVGTNNLVSEKPEEMAGKMDDLIKSLKGNARMIAISGVIKRYDNRVQASKISHFNHLVKNLCANHNATFFNNDHIDRSLLNRSNLHLNREGDRALGSVFCSYLKSSVRVRTAGNSLNPTENRIVVFFTKPMDIRTENGKCIYDM